MKKGIKLVFFGALLVGSLAACEKEEVTNNTDTKDTTTDNPVAEKTLSGITVNADSVKKSYTYGEALDLTGLVVTAKYSDETTAGVAEYTTNPANGTTLNEVGNKDVTVTYQGKTDKFTVVVGKTLTGITLNTDAVKKSYAVGEVLDLTGLVVTASYNDGSSEQVTDYSVSSDTQGAFTTAGESSVVVSYKGKTAGFKVSVANNVTGITLNTDAVKKTYNYGDNLDTTGLVVTANYSDNTSSAITGYTVSPANNTALNQHGEVTVTVTYENNTATYKVNVNKVVTSLSINKTNFKSDYHYGEALDLTGLVVNAKYSDGSVVDVTASATFDTPNGSTLTGSFGPKDIRVEFGGKSTVFSVNIQPNEEKGTTVTVNLNRTLNFGSMMSSSNKATFTATGTPGTLYQVTMNATKNSNKEDSMTLVGGKTRFYKGDYIENIQSIPGITKITVHGGNGYYHLSVGYTKDNLHKFLFAESDSGDRIYDNIPNVNFFMLMGSQDDHPADISSIEIEYERDSNGNTVAGVAKSITDVNVVDGIYLGNSKTIAVNGTTALVDSDEYTFVGIEYMFEKQDYVLYRNHTGKGLLMHFNGSTEIEVLDVDNSFSEFSGTYSINVQASSVTINVNGTPVGETSATNRVNINIGDTFDVSATCDAIPVETPVVSLVDESNGDNDPYVGTYTLRSTVTIEEIMQGLGTSELKIDPIDVTKSGDGYKVTYKDYAIDDYTGNEGVFDATVKNGVISFENEDGYLSVDIDTTEKNVKFTYNDGDVYFNGDKTAYNFVSNDKPTATYSNGKVTAVSGGDFYINAVTTNNIEARYYVHVNSYVPATVTVDFTTVEIEIGTFRFITAKVNDDATDKTLTYTSADSSIAITNGAVVTGVSVGETTVTIKTVDNNTATVTVKVKAAPQTVVYTFDDDNGDSHELVVYVDDEAYLDDFYVFEFVSFNGNEWYRLKTDEDIGFKIRISGAQAYLDYFDYAEEIFCPTGVVCCCPYDYEGTIFMDEDTSSSGGFTPIIIVPAAVKYTFEDANGDEHIVEVTSHTKIVIDGKFVFNYSVFADNYVYAEDSSVVINIDERGATFLCFTDPNQVIFGYFSEIYMTDLENDIQIYEVKKFM